MKSSVKLLTVATIALICMMGIVDGQRTRPTTAASSSSSGTRLPTRNTAQQPSSAGNNGNYGSGNHGDHGDHDDGEDQRFRVEDLAGTHAFKAFGTALVGGVGAPITVPGTTTTYPTYPDSLWISMEGRLCINEKGECAVNAWVNVGGHTSIHLDTANPSSTVPAGQQCRVTVDEFGQGVAYVPVVLTPDEGATISLPNFPSFIVIKFQVYGHDADHSYFEIEGCGPQGTITFSGPTSGLPGFAGNAANQVLLQYIQHVCTPAEVANAGRRPISLSGESSRISFRCSNCKKDDFAWYGSECNDICPAEEEGHGNHGGGRGGYGNGGPRGGRNNGGHDSLDM